LSSVIDEQTLTYMSGQQQAITKAKAKLRLQMHFVLLAGLTLPQMLIWYSLVAASAAGGVPLCI
jgi:hypothetical protein